MFRQISTVVLVVLAALGSVAVAAAAEPKEADGKTKSPPKELSVDLGKGVKLEMVLIPAGEFMMGTPDTDKEGFGDQKPQHRVRITRPFFLGKYLVTQVQWEAVMGNNPSQFQGPKNPVEQVSTEDCQKFLDKLNALPGGGKFQLPSEAQWEYACRAGTTTRYFFGDDDSKLAENAWFASNANSKSHPVGEKKPNAWGLYDMHGNVWEWCQDWFSDKYYAASPTDDPTGPATGTSRVLRGGSWDTSSRRTKSAVRDGISPGEGSYDVGFRVCRTAAEK